MTVRTAVLVVVSLCAATHAAARQGASASFDSSGVSIHYSDRGAGQPVVLLHGLTGSAARHFEAPGAVDALVKTGYRAIAMDLRGHGESGKPQDPGSYGLNMVEDVARLLDHLKINRAHIVGYSLGGAVASQFLLRHPERVLSVSLIGAGWAGEDPSPFTAQLTALAAAFERKDATPLIRGVTAGGKPATGEEIAALNAGLFARNDPVVLAAVTRGSAPLYDVTAAALRAIKVPVLAVVGDLDVGNVEAVQRMKGVMPALEVVMLPGATHASSVGPAAAHIVTFLGKYGIH